MPAEGTELRPAVFPLERTIYEAGTSTISEKALGVTGDRVLYVGDHIYGDILRSKKESAWRTDIIQEMEAEVLAHEACREEHSKVTRSRSGGRSSRISFASTSTLQELTKKIDDDPTA